MMAGLRERARRKASPEMTVLVDAMAAGLWLRMGELDRAAELVERAEAGMDVALPVGAEHGTALVNAVRASLCIQRGDPAGAEVALARAYAAAIESRDMPIVSMVAVTAADLAALLGRPRDVALLLGAAARLRGTHDRTDPQVRELSRRGRAALGDDDFAEAYEMGWELDGKAASAQVDPARLRAELPAADGQARRL
jgi:hypothetical protein